ncbi:MAG: hypothetical protein MGG11_17185 [Trichodesmium sp. MAG_R03]|nr:hypothetical protein [Trichodesmium sp. MAG_R03]
MKNLSLDLWYCWFLSITSGAIAYKLIFFFFRIAFFYVILYNNDKNYFIQL